MSKEDLKLQKDLGIKLKPRKLCGSIDQANDELRDAYLNYKDIANRCLIDFQAESAILNKNDDDKYNNVLREQAKTDELNMKPPTSLSDSDSEGL